MPRSRSCARADPRDRVVGRHALHVRAKIAGRVRGEGVPLIGPRVQGRLLTKDLDLFHWVAGSHTPWLDEVLPKLSRSANHSALWLGTAGLLGLTRGRRRRAAVWGLLSVAIASPLAN